MCVLFKWCNIMMSTFWLDTLRMQENLYLWGKISKHRLLQWHSNASTTPVEGRRRLPIGDEITPAPINKRSAWAGRAERGAGLSPKPLLGFTGSPALVSLAQVICSQDARGERRRGEESGERGDGKVPRAGLTRKQDNRPASLFVFGPLCDQR